MGYDLHDDKELDKAEIRRKQLLELCWAKGRLKYKLYDHQIPLYEKLIAAINDPDCLQYALVCSRQWGKSTILCLIATEYALRKPHTQIRFAMPTAKSLRKTMEPIMIKLSDDAPEQYKPTLYGNTGIWNFSNGSQIHMAGTDANNADSLRGTSSNLNVIDEAGFCSNLLYIKNSILIPQTITTGGTTVMASTPPKTLEHDFYQIKEECERENHYSIYTVWDNPSITPKLLQNFVKTTGGMETTDWKREYECQFIVDEKSVVIPEWKADYIIKEIPKNDYYCFYRKYVAMDLGTKDFTAVIFGYYDFAKAKLVIEDEWMLNGPEVTSLAISNAVKAKEKELWNVFPVHLRISDNNDQSMINGLSNMHQMHFSPTNKDTLDAMINEVRLMVDAGRILIHERCTQLIGCMINAAWAINKDNTNKRALKRSPLYGHYDHLMALVYLVRNIDYDDNPIPRHYGYNPYDNFYTGEKNSSSDLPGSFKTMFPQTKHRNL